MDGAAEVRGKSRRARRKSANDKGSGLMDLAREAAGCQGIRTPQGKRVANLHVSYGPIDAMLTVCGL